MARRSWIFCAGAGSIALLFVVLFLTWHSQALQVAGSVLDDVAKIRRGMKAAEVVAILGEPNLERFPDVIQLPACVRTWELTERDNSAVRSIIDLEPRITVVVEFDERDTVERERTKRYPKSAR